MRFKRGCCCFRFCCWIEWRWERNSKLKIKYEKNRFMMQKKIGWRQLNWRHGIFHIYKIDRHGHFFELCILECMCVCMGGVCMVIFPFSKRLVDLCAKKSSFFENIILNITIIIIFKWHQANAFILLPSHIKCIWIWIWIFLPVCIYYSVFSP